MSFNLLSDYNEVFLSVNGKVFEYEGRKYRLEAYKMKAIYPFPCVTIDVTAWPLDGDKYGIDVLGSDLDVSCDIMRILGIDYNEESERLELVS